MGAASESGAEVFPVIYFEREAFLRQDPQLHRQLLIAAGFDKVFDLGPNWRAEPSHTPRHLCEHRACAAELAFIKDETDVMRAEERWL
jgi:aspartyl-tRNA synthetase